MIPSAKPTWQQVALVADLEADLEADLVAAALEAGLVPADRVAADLVAVAPEAELVVAPNLHPQLHPHPPHLRRHPLTAPGQDGFTASSKVHFGIDSPMMSMRSCNSQEDMLGTQVAISL